MPRKRNDLAELEGIILEQEEELGLLEAENKKLKSMLADLLRPTIFGSISVVTAQAAMFAGTEVAAHKRRIDDYIKMANGYLKEMKDVWPERPSD